MSEFPPVGNKRILVLANYDVGLYKFREKLLRTLVEQGNEVFVSLPYGDLVPQLERIGCVFIDTALERRGMNPCRDISLYRQYRRILSEIKPDLVIAYTVKPNVYGGLACRRAGVPYAANITGLGSAIEGGGMLRRLVLAMYKAGLKKARVVFFENEGNRDVLVQAGVVKKSKTHVLHGAGVDTAEYLPMPYPAGAPGRFLFVGRIMREKGVDELFTAMRRLRAAYGDRVVLDVVGIFEESYQKQVEDLQADGTIVFHGYQTDVKPYYARADCVVLPSYHEGMSNVLLEGAASGRALITSDIHGCKEAVIDGKSGFLVPPGNAELLYEKMREFLELPEAAKAEMGRQGRIIAETQFEKTVVVRETLAKLME